MIIPFSAQTKQGREEIWEIIDQLTGFAEEKENVDGVSKETDGEK